MEIWREVADFPMYEVSNYGRIVNGYSGHEMAMNENQYGVVYVGLVGQDGVQHIRVVSRVVALAWIPRPYPAFDTPINLNGDRYNNRVDNLLWRPRWFAIRYVQQFKHKYHNHISNPIECLNDANQFENSFDAAIHYGLLEKDLVLAIINKTNVWPSDLYFEVILE